MFSFNLNEFKTDPFPHLVIDNFLSNTVAKQIQHDILSIPTSEFDRYSNPFENKNTLKNKNNFPQSIKDLFEQLRSQEFLNKLTELSGVEIINDDFKQYWGVHTYNPGDKLNIHVDAGLNPQTGFKKYLTLGIYLSYNWKDELGGNLELWSGDSAEKEYPQIYECVKSIVPSFNRMILFVCNDYSWHGNPIPTKGTIDNKRIFVTISYLTKEKNLKDCLNTRKRAYFASKRNEKDELKEVRDLRSDDKNCELIYRYNSSLKTENLNEK